MLRLIVLACAFSALIVSSAAEGKIEIPPKGQILATLRKEHPRLFINGDQFIPLKQQVQSDPLLKEWHATLLARGEKFLNEPPSTYEIPDGLRLLAVSRQVLGRVQTLALLHRTTGKKEFAERAWAELNAAAKFPDWNPKHFLDTAEMTHAFAVGYDWLYQYWSPEQKSVLRDAMVEKGLRLAEGVYNGTLKLSAWHKARHNWNQVCNGGIAIGALAVADELPELASEILAHASNSIQLAMREFAPDGAWAEGPGYWNYATIYNVSLLAALDSALGTDFGLHTIPGFRFAGDFPIYLTGPLGRTFNYADGGDGTIRAAQMFWLARKFEQPAYSAYQKRVASAHLMDLIWYQPTASEVSLPLDKYFREAEVVTMRSAWNERDAVFVGFKGGDNKANHSNLDLGTFVLDALGVRWGMDLGADNYNLPGYFGKTRWSYYRLRAEGHNTIVINPSAEPDQDPAGKAKIVKFESSPDRTFALADLSGGYVKSGAQVRRGIALIDRARVVVQDEIAVGEPAEIWWFFHTPAEIQIEGDGSALLRRDGEQLRAKILFPSGAKFEVRNAVPLPNSAHPEKQNPNDGIRKLAIQLRQAKETRIVVLLSPEHGSSKAELPKIVPLANW